MTTYNNQQQAIILKGIAQQILQMNIPTFNVVEKMFKEFEIFSNITTFVYSDSEIRKCLLALLIYSGANSNQGLNSIKGDSFEEKIDIILKNSLISNNAIELVSKLSKEKEFLNMKTSWNKEEVVSLINKFENDTFPLRYEGYPTEQEDIDRWIEDNL